MGYSARLAKLAARYSRLRLICLMQLLRSSVLKECTLFILDYPEMLD